MNNYLNQDHFNDQDGQWFGLPNTFIYETVYKFVIFKN